MICKLTGVVTRLTSDGFIVLPDGGTEEQCVATQLPGQTLRLAIGDRVEVFGGPDPKTGEFASAWASRQLPDGSSVPLRINLSDPPD